jgi:hypothetical protein
MTAPSADFRGAARAARLARGTRCLSRTLLWPDWQETSSMKGILLWLLGVPIPIIILIYLLF